MGQQTVPGYPVLIDDRTLENVNYLLQLFTVVAAKIVINKVKRAGVYKNRAILSAYNRCSYTCGKCWKLM